MISAGAVFIETASRVTEIANTIQRERKDKEKSVCHQGVKLNFTRDPYYLLGIPTSTPMRSLE
jgi:hypothetical protein